MLSSQEKVSFEIEHFALLKPSLERLDHEKFDVALTDLQLPDSNKLESFQKLHAKAPDMPIVIITGTHEEYELAIQSLKEGAQDYLRKSEVNPDSLIRAIRYSMERQKTKNELNKAYSDLKSTQEQLIQSEKLAGLARFSEGIAHEVRNPLGIIMGGVEFLEKKLSDADINIKNSVDMIKNAALRASDILSSFLVYAKSRSKTAEKSDLGDIVSKIAASLRKNVSLANIKLTTEMKKENMCVKIDKGRIEEAITNILNNAVEAMPGGGSINIKGYIAPMPGSSSGRQACIIQIDDTGAGISNENMKKIFEPFFTTKIRTAGKGRGLFTAKTSVESFDGTISIESVEGKGTSVKVALPWCND
jgi:signal transduction histidine kinase